MRNFFDMSRDKLDIIDDYSGGFCLQFVTMDKTQVQHFQLETKEQSKWKHQGSPVPKKAKTLMSAWKVMALIF